MTSEKELRKEHYDRFVQEICAKAAYEVQSMQIMETKVDLNNPNEILAAYWLLKNTSWIKTEENNA